MTNEDEMNEIWPGARRYFRNEGDGDDLKASQRLAKILGYDYPEMDHFRKLKLTKAQKETIKQLPKIFKSPHKEALLKAIEARYAIKR